MDLEALSKHCIQSLLRRKLCLAAYLLLIRITPNSVQMLVWFSPYPWHDPNLSNEKIICELAAFPWISFSGIWPRPKAAHGAVGFSSFDLKQQWLFFLAYVPLYNIVKAPAPRIPFSVLSLRLFWVRSEVPLASLWLQTSLRSAHIPTLPRYWQFSGQREKGK